MARTGGPLAAPGSSAVLAVVSARPRCRCDVPRSPGCSQRHAVRGGRPSTDGRAQTALTHRVRQLYAGAAVRAGDVVRGHRNDRDEPLVLDRPPRERSRGAPRAMCTVLGARLVLHGSFVRNTGGATYGTWLARFRMGTAMTGACWGATSLALPHDPEQPRRTRCSSPSCSPGVSPAPGVPYLATVFAVYRHFAILILVPTFGVMLMRGDRMHFSLFALVSIVYLATLLGGQTCRRCWTEGLQLRSSQTDLVHSLTSTNSELPPDARHARTPRGRPHAGAAQPARRTRTCRGGTARERRNVPSHHRQRDRHDRRLGPRTVASFSAAARSRGRSCAATSRCRNRVSARCTPTTSTACGRSCAGLVRGCRAGR